MRPLQGELLLQAWEHGANEGYLERSLTMLHLACPELQMEQLAAMPLAQLNLQFLRLRQISFGSSVAGFLPCPRCATRLELSVPIASLIDRLEPSASREALNWTEGSVEYSVRALCTRDLILAQLEEDTARARRLLLDRCISSSHGNEIEPNKTATALRKFDELHVAAEIILQVTCSGCGQTEAVDLDIARFLWMEVRHAAVRLLHDVHDLASAYSWQETAILAMTPQRRSAYLEMVRE